MPRVTIHVCDLCTKAESKGRPVLIQVFDNGRDVLYICGDCVDHLATHKARLLRSQYPVPEVPEAANLYDETSTFPVLDEVDQPPPAPGPDEERFGATSQASPDTLTSGWPFQQDPK